MLNDTGLELSFPVILATTDSEDRDNSHRSVRVGSWQAELEEAADLDAEWATLGEAIKASAAAQGYAPERIEAYLALLRR